MLHFSAHSFFWCGTALRTITGDCIAGSVSVLNGEPVFITGKDLDDTARKKVLSLLPSVEKAFKDIGLVITAETVEELIGEVKGETRYSFDWLAAQVRALERLAEKELKNKLFLYVPSERAKYWPKAADPHLFGDSVAQAFPSASFDIQNAGMCLAAAFSTASVFHLMRVMEIGLTVLGAQFNVSLAHTNWGPALSEIESKIRDMHKDPKWKALPDCKEQQEFFAQAATHFGILKDAWRNYTMHVRGKYTEDEADQIFDASKGFMQKLATRLKE